MPFGSLNDIIIYNTFCEEAQSVQNNVVSGSIFSRTMSLLKQEFHDVTDEQLLHFLNILVLVYNHNNNEKIQLVITAPLSFNLRTKLTENVVEDILQSAKKSILMTGYSISEYINKYLDLIIKKSQSGVFVKIFINNIAEQGIIDKLLRYNGKFLQIYNYTSADDRISALHAKVLSVDGTQSLISSANLSYHGMMGNIELGCHIESARIAKEIDEAFKQLLFQKVFRRV